VLAIDYYELYDEFNQPRCLSVSTQLYCRGFDSWLQATALLNNAPDLRGFSYINLKSNSPLLLNSDLNITKAIAHQPDYNFKIHIYGLKGVNLIGWLNNKEKVTLLIYASSLKFYSEDLAPGDYQCTEHLNSTFFSYFLEVSFIDSVVYDRDVAMCPYTFFNTNLYFLRIGNLIDSFVVNNLFKFQTALHNASSSINSTVSYFFVEGYHISLDETLMHPQVFESVKELDSYSSIGSIQIDLFKSFKNLNNINSV
jgi:hypothetical protein